MVQADFVALPAEDDGRTQFVLAEIQRLNDSGVIQAIQDEVFPLGRLLDSLPFTGFGGCNVIEPYAAGRLGGRMFGGEVLAREQRVLSIRSVRT